MTTKLPTKPGAAGVGANAAVVLVWLLGEFNVVVPPEVAASMVSLVAGAVYFLTPAKE